MGRCRDGRGLMRIIGLRFRVVCGAEIEREWEVMGG
jgi:hypothetical protein